MNIFYDLMFILSMGLFIYGFFLLGLLYGIFATATIFLFISFLGSFILSKDKKEKKLEDE